MPKVYFNNVQKIEKKGEMWCLLQVVKWFTKCLFYNWLLKICIDLPLHAVSFFMSCFANVPTFLPVDCSCLGSCLYLEAKAGAHTTKFDFILFLSLQFCSSVNPFSMWKMSINVSLLQGSIQQKTVPFI